MPVSKRQNKRVGQDFIRQLVGIEPAKCIIRRDGLGRIDNIEGGGAGGGHVAVLVREITVQCAVFQQAVARVCEYLKVLRGEHIAVGVIVDAVHPPPDRELSD